MQPQCTTAHLIDRFWSYVAKSDTCWLWTKAKKPSGYGHFRWHGRSAYAHRIAWELTYGTIPAGMSILHHCDTPLCVRPEHLFLGTHPDNMRDMSAKGRTFALQHPERLARGERHGSAKLTADQVQTIRTIYMPGSRETGQRALARRFNVDPRTIAFIVEGDHWRHLL